MADLAVIEAEPQADDIIDTLERALVRAKAGELSSVAVCYVYRDGAIGFRRSNLPSYPAMVGSLTKLVHKLCREMDE